jgi:hypothetical protein
MSEKRDEFISFGILICLVIIAISLLIIASKPAQQLSFNSQPPLQIQQLPTDSVIQLGPDRIAVIDVDQHSGMYGTVGIFDIDTENNTFKMVGKFDYSKDFRYPSVEPVSKNDSR